MKDLDIPDDCIDKISDRVITLKEKKTKVYFENPDRTLVEKIKINHCAMIEVIACDFLLMLQDARIGHFVELKGKNIMHAIDQLIASVKYIKPKIVLSQKFCWIVSTGHPLNSAKVEQERKKFQRSHQVRLEIVRSGDSIKKDRWLNL